MMVRDQFQTDEKLEDKTSCRWYDDGFNDRCNAACDYIDDYNTSSIDRVIGVSPLVGGLLGSAI